MPPTADCSNENIPPVFFFGFERSGTTLLSMMLGAHPQMAVPLSVTGLWYSYAERAEAYGGLATPADLERMVDHLLAEERIRLWDTTFAKDEVLAHLQPGSFSAIVERFHRLYAQHHGKPYWGNLDIATLDHMDVANRWFPDARFVHIVRDGRDVALSHETMPYGTSNVLECAEKWTHRLHVNLKMGALLGTERYLVVRYEDLVLDSEATLKRICRFIGMPYSSAMLDYPSMVETKIPEDRRWLWPALDKQPVKSKVYGWKSRMTKTRRVVFEGVANEMLKALGYEAYGRPPKYVPAYGYELWCFMGRGGRFRRIARKFGMGHTSLLERQWQKTRKMGGGGYEAGQQEAFGSLVSSGVYDKSFKHNPAAQAFFRDSMDHALDSVQAGDGIAVLECGCGPGAWMDFVNHLAAGRAAPLAGLYGFDITPEMIEVARERLAQCVPVSNLHLGDILKDDSYDFDQPGQRFQVIYAYDVIQQLPRKLQYEACQAVLRRLAPGGVAVLFDHDCASPFGREMGVKKFLTRYLGLSLVPRYYCNARYPALRRIASRIEATGQFVTEIRVASDGRKCALIIRSRPGPVRCETEPGPCPAT